MSGSLNLDLLALLDFFENRVALGCDFLSYRDDLLVKMHTHVSDFFADGGENLQIEIPKVSELRELIDLLRNFADKKYQVDCYTKYDASLHDLIEFHKLKNIQIFETKNRHIQSFIDEKNKHVVFADDVFSSLFVKERGSGNIAKNLDLLLSLSP